MFQIATYFLEFPFAILPVNGRMIAERALSCNLLKEVACEKRCFVRQKRYSEPNAFGASCLLTEIKFE